MSNPLTTETLEELERLYGRLQAITDHPLEVDQDADEPAIIYVHSRGEKCADGRHHTYMVGLAHMSEDWKDDGRPLADAVVAIINAFPALLAAARERETIMDECRTRGVELKHREENYVAAVRGRQEMCDGLREARQEIKELRALAEQMESDRDYARGALLHAIDATTVELGDLVTQQPWRAWLAQWRLALGRKADA